jgi:hypothetical protein
MCFQSSTRSLVQHSLHLWQQQGSSGLYNNWMEFITSLISYAATLMAIQEPANSWPYPPTVLLVRQRDCKEGCQEGQLANRFLDCPSSGTYFFLAPRPIHCSYQLRICQHPWTQIRWQSKLWGTGQMNYKIANHAKSRIGWLQSPATYTSEHLKALFHTIASSWVPNQISTIVLGVV